MRPLSVVLLFLLGAVTVVPDAHPVHRTTEAAVEVPLRVAWHVVKGAGRLAYGALLDVEHRDSNGRASRARTDSESVVSHGVEGTSTVAPDVVLSAGRSALNDRLTANVDRVADHVARSVPSEAERSLEALAEHLAERAGPTMRGRTRAAFRWVAEHVTYDVDATRGLYARPDQSPRAVLRSGRAVCEGYARLFVALADRMGLEVAYVVGTADPVGPGGGGGHAWAAVELADGWYLLDPTWAAGGTTRDGRFVRSFDPDWWLVPPERMGRTHRPRDARWMLGARLTERRSRSRIPWRVRALGLQP